MRRRSQNGNDCVQPQQSGSLRRQQNRLERFAFPSRLAQVETPPKRAFFDPASSWIWRAIVSGQNQLNQRPISPVRCGGTEPRTDLDPIIQTREISGGRLPVLHSALGQIVYSQGPGLYENTLDWHSERAVENDNCSNFRSH
jgi:hypothetical protein